MLFVSVVFIILYSLFMIRYSKYKSLYSSYSYTKVEDHLYFMELLLLIFNFIVVLSIVGYLLFYILFMVSNGFDVLLQVSIFTLVYCFLFGGIYLVTYLRASYLSSRLEELSNQITKKVESISQLTSEV